MAKRKNKQVERKSKAPRKKRSKREGMRNKGKTRQTLNVERACA